MQKLTQEQQTLVKKNLGLAQRLAMIAWAKHRTQDGEELVSIAYQGLVTAARRFDPTRADIDPDDLENGKAFSGYARQRIVGSLLDWQRKADFVPRSVRKQYKEFQSMAGEGKEIVVSEIALEAELPEATVRKVISAVSNLPVSLDSTAPGDGEDSEESNSGSNLRQTTSGDDVESSAVVSLICGTLADTWKGLPFIQRAAIANRFYYNMSAKASAEQIGCTSQEISLALSEAVSKLAEAMRDTVHEETRHETTGL